LRWQLALPARSRQSRRRMHRRSSNVILRRHLIRTRAGGPIVSLMAENAGTKASPGFRNRCWNGPRRLPRHQPPARNLQGRPRRKAIQWMQKRWRHLTRLLSISFGVPGSKAVKKQSTPNTRCGLGCAKVIYGVGSIGRSLGNESGFRLRDNSQARCEKRPLYSLNRCAKPQTSSTLRQSMISSGTFLRVKPLVPTLPNPSSSRLGNQSS
jgi:hypothetical protein